MLGLRFLFPFHIRGHVIHVSFWRLMGWEYSLGIIEVTPKVHATCQSSPLSYRMLARSSIGLGNCSLGEKGCV